MLKERKIRLEKMEEGCNKKIEEKRKQRESSNKIKKERAEER